MSRKHPKLDVKLPEKGTSLLAYCLHPNILAWKLGKYNILMDRFYTLRTCRNIGRQDAPAYVKVSYSNLSDIVDFIHNSGIKTIRLFKTTKYRNNAPHGFYYHAAKNLMGSFGDKKTIWKISSNNTKIRDEFYRIAKEINEEFNWKNGFDYDNYDLEFVLKEYTVLNKHTNRNKILITYFHGKDFHNKTM